MNRHLVDIIDELVSKLSFDIKILECNVVDGQAVLRVCDTKHIICGSKITIDTTEYLVMGIVNNESITINSNTCPLGDSLNIKAPNYFHGTVIATGNEIQSIKDSENVVPIAYLYEVLKEKRSRDYKSIVERESTVQMFFLEDANFEDWLTDDHYRMIIGAMDSLAEGFVTLVEENMYYGDAFDYEVIPHAKFGRYNKEGHITNVFNRELSGVELRIPIRIFKDCSCKECK